MCIFHACADEGWQGSEEAVRFGADGHGYWEPNTVPPEDKPSKCS